MKRDYKYFAFISYKSEDKEWGEWFQRELEGYHLPSTLNGIPDVPNSFRPIFRDVSELEAGDLPEQINDALDNSLNLIVICSPRSAQSEWVNKEILSFIELGRKKGIDNIKKIFPFIIEGEPYLKDEQKRCFPEALVTLKDQGRERVGGDVKEESREKAFVKVLAGMLPKAITFDMLWNRYERDKIEKERKEREQRDKLLIAQSRVIADKSKECLEQGDSFMARLLALEALPKNLSDPNDRPYVPAAERILRESDLSNNCVLRNRHEIVNCAVFAHGKHIIASGGSGSEVIIWDCLSGQKIDSVQTHTGVPISCLSFTPDDKYLIIGFDRPTSHYNERINLSSILLYNRISRSIKKFEKLIFADSLHVTNDGICFIKYYNKVSGYRLPNFAKIWEIEIQDTYSFETYASDFHQSTNQYAVITLKSVQIIDVRTGQMILYDTINNPHKKTCVSFSNEGSHLFLSLGNEVVIYKIEEKHIKGKKQFDKIIVKMHSFHKLPYVICVFDDNSVISWNYLNLQEEKVLLNSTDKIQHIDIAKNDGFIAVSCVNGNVYIKSCIKKLCRVQSGIEKPDSLNETDMAYTVYGDYTLIGFDKTELKKVFLVDDIVSNPCHYNNSCFYYVKIINEQTPVVCLKNGVESVFYEDTIAGYSFHNIHSNFICFDDSSMLYCNMENNIVFQNATGVKENITYVPSQCYMVLSDDKKFVIIVLVDVGEESDLLLFDIESKKVNHLIKMNEVIKDISISSDSKYVVAVGEESTLFLYNVSSQEIVREKVFNSSLYFVCFTPDNSILTASENGAINYLDINDINNDREIYQYGMRFNLHGFTKQAISSCGRYLLAGQCDNSSLHVIDLQSLEIIATYGYHKSSVVSAIFSEKGQYIISLSSDGEIIKKEFKPLQELIDENRLRFKDRSFTDIEKRKFYIE